MTRPPLPAKSGQQQIPVPEPKPTPKSCAWCGKPAYRDFEVEPGRNGAKGRFLPPKTAPVCRPCDARLSNQPQNRS